MLSLCFFAIQNFKLGSLRMTRSTFNTMVQSLCFLSFVFRASSSDFEVQLGPGQAPRGEDSAGCPGGTVRPFGSIRDLLGCLQYCSLSLVKN